MNPMALVHALASRAGYSLVKRDFQRYGVDPLVDVARLAARLDRPIRRILDVGANDGATYRALRRAFRDALIVAYEPHPDTFSRLEAVVRPDTHPRPGSTRFGWARQIALTDHVSPADPSSNVGELTFYEYASVGSDSALNSLEPQTEFTTIKQMTPRAIKVPASTLDLQFYSGIGNWIDLLKIDVEGHEMAVLRGAKRLLQERRIGFIYAEFNDVLPRPGVSALQEMAAYLAPYGFRFVATYVDRVDLGEQIHVLANALFVAERMETRTRSEVLADDPGGPVAVDRDLVSAGARSGRAKR